MTDSASRVPAPPEARDEEAPRSPLELPPRDWRATLRRTLREIKEDRITLVAAGMGFYWFVAIFPALIAAVGVLGLLNVSPSVVAGINDTIRSTLPPEAAQLLTAAVDDANQASERTALTAAAIGIAIALWSASSGMVALQAGLDVAYDVSRDRPFLKKRLVAFGLLVAAALLGGVPSPFFAFGEGAALRILAWLVTAACLVLLFALFYYLGPNRDSPRWQWLTPGGVLGGGLWVLASLAFSFYVRNFSSYGKTYGALAGVVVLVFWLYLTALSILVGAELNAELEEQREMNVEG